MKIFSPYTKSQKVATSKGEAKFNDEGWADVSEELGKHLLGMGSKEYFTEEVEAVRSSGTVGRVQGIGKNTVISSSVVKTRGLAGLQGPTPVIPKTAKQLSEENPSASSDGSENGSEGGEDSIPTSNNNEDGEATNPDNLTPGAEAGPVAPLAGNPSNLISGNLEMPMNPSGPAAAGFE